MLTLKTSLRRWHFRLVLGWCNIWAYHFHLLDDNNWQLWTPIVRVFIYGPKSGWGRQG